MRKFFEIYRKQILSCVILLFFGFNFVIWSSVFKKAAEPDLSVYFFDVGQGDSEFISAKDGTQILIDGGPNTKVLSELGRVMPYYDNSIDLVILTHQHADHVTGLIDVLNRYKIGMVIESGADYNTAEYHEFERIIKAKNIKKIIIDSPVEMYFYGGAVLKFLYPERSYDGEVLKNVHDATVVGELNFEDKKILFMGDAEKNIEARLVYEDAVGDIDVLKVGHHGSKTSSNTFFLEATKPEYAIISVGAKNRYGHPTQQTLSNLEAIGAKIFRTDLDGTIKLSISNGTLKLISGK
ncbi:MAG: MBL fold metallo-hydrolase [bacterium]|nr:MBL fold metallo-hydrolase [bacterium]